MKAILNKKPSDSAPIAVGVRKNSIKNKNVGINKGCSAIERKLARRVFKSFLSKSLKRCKLLKMLHIVNIKFRSLLKQP